MFLRAICICFSGNYLLPSLVIFLFFLATFLFLLISVSLWHLGSSHALKWLAFISAEIKVLLSVCDLCFVLCLSCSYFTSIFHLYVVKLISIFFLWRLDFEFFSRKIFPSAKS